MMSHNLQLAGTKIGAAALNRMPVGLFGNRIAEAGGINLSAAPPSITADGTSFTTITADVRDAGNNPVPDGTLVTFSTSLGALSAGSATTIGGIAQVQLFSSTTTGTAAVRRP